MFVTIIPVQVFGAHVNSARCRSRAWQLSIFCLLAAVAMEDVTRLVSSGDCLKIWDSSSMTVLEQFNPHSATHPVAQMCWSSSSILYHCHITLNHYHQHSVHHLPTVMSVITEHVFGSHSFEEIIPSATMLTTAKCEISLTLKKGVEKL